MLQRVRMAACLPIGLLLVLTGCKSTSSDSIDSPRLTSTDIEVLRVAIASEIQPRIRSYVRTHPARLVAATLTFGPAQRAQAGLPAPPPSPSFNGPAGLRTLLTPDERAAWRVRNSASFEIPDLGLSELVNRREVDPEEEGPIVSVSAPIYPTKGTAMIYAGFVCGGLCGEGRLIRLSRDGSTWRVIDSQMLWIS